jgi:hypothetical protein
MTVMPWLLSYVSGVSQVPLLGDTTRPTVDTHTSK